MPDVLLDIVGQVGEVGVLSRAVEEARVQLLVTWIYTQVFILEIIILQDFSIALLWQDAVILPFWTQLCILCEVLVDGDVAKPLRVHPSQHGLRFFDC